MKPGPTVEVVVTKQTVVTERTVVGGKYVFVRELENKEVVIRRGSKK